jgi:hypothetical protein
MAMPLHFVGSSKTDLLKDSPAKSVFLVIPKGTSVGVGKVMLEGQNLG